MKHLVIMLLCSFPVLASANWAGFPFTNNPVTNWPDVVTNFDPLAQLHSAGIERRQVAGADWNVQLSENPTWICGFTNGTNVYEFGTNYVTVTNRLPVWSNIWTFVTTTNGTNVSVSTNEGYSFDWLTNTNRWTSNTVLNLDGSTSVIYRVLDRNFDGIPNLLYYLLKGGQTTFVCTNEAAGDPPTFNDWFMKSWTNPVYVNTSSIPWVTNAATTNYPADFPHTNVADAYLTPIYADPQKVFYSVLGSNCVDASTFTTDYWGAIHGNNDAMLPLGGSNDSMVMAQSSCSNRVTTTNGITTTNFFWDFRQFQGDVLYTPSTNNGFIYPYSPAIRVFQHPVLTYTTTNASIPVLTFVLQGTYTAAQTSTYDVVHGWQVGFVSEAVTVTGTNTVCLTNFTCVTNIVCPTNLTNCAGDSITVQYTNGVQIYSGVGNYGEPYYSGPLNGCFLDQSQRLLNAYRWATASGSWSSNGVKLVWSGSSPNNWADAVAVAQTSACTTTLNWQVYVYTNDFPTPGTAHTNITRIYQLPGIQVAGQYQIWTQDMRQKWDATLTACVGWPEATNRIYYNGHMSNYAHEVSFYVGFLAAGTFDDEGAAYVDLSKLGILHLYGTPEIGIDFPYTFTHEIGNANFPANWAANDPTPAVTPAVDFVTNTRYGWTTMGFSGPQNGWIPRPLIRFDLTNAAGFCYF